MIIKQTKKYVFWIILIFGFLSLIRFLGIALTYSQNLLLHSLGNNINIFLLFPFNLITYTIGAFLGIFVFIFLLLKKVSFKYALVPLLYSLLTALAYVVGITFTFGTSFLESSIFQILSDNYLVMIFNILIFTYSMYILKKIKYGL
ncbi:MAG: hypothetical protein AABX07_00145 [Nanoarchaeota archaeon]